MIREVKTITKSKPTNKKYNEVAKRIEKLTGLDVFQNVRNQEIVDARAMMCYILNKYYSETLHGIARYFRENGKRFDHSTVYYNIQLYANDVSKRRRDLSDNLMYFVGTVDSTTHLNIILDTVLSSEDQQRVIDVVNRLVNKYSNRSVI
jgi:hypothetical protein